MNAAADPVVELVEAVRACAIGSGHFFLTSADDAEAAFNDDLLDALALPASVLVVRIEVSDSAPGDPNYVRTMPHTLGRMPTGCWGAVPDVERARKYGFSEDEIAAAVRRVQSPQEAATQAAAARRADEQAEQPSVASAAPAQAVDAFPPPSNVILLGQRLKSPPGVKYDGNGNPVWIGS